MNNLLTLKDISKSFYSKKGETKVLDNISFSIKENEIVALLGPSGCGKSTLLNILSDLDLSYEGMIQKDCKIGYMFQKDCLMNWRTVYDNIIIGLEINKLLTKENIDYVKNLIHKYQLNDFINYHPEELSGGMRQRVSLIRTLSMKPDLLLLDEPFSALDSQTRLFVQEDVFKILKEEKKSALIVTHDIAEAVALSNTIVILSSRPAHIEKIIHLSFLDNETPITRRKISTFSTYFNDCYESMHSVLPDK